MIDVDNILPEVLYVIEDARPAGKRYSDPYNPVRQFVRTPDGRGCHWYDEADEDEARGDVCEVERVRQFDTIDEFEDYRYRETE